MFSNVSCRISGYLGRPCPMEEKKEQVSVQPAVVQPAAVQPAAVPPAAVQPAAVVPPAAVQPAAVQPAVQPMVVYTQSPTLNRIINQNKKDLDDFNKKVEEIWLKSPEKLYQFSEDKERDRLLDMYNHNLREGKDFDQKHKILIPRGLTELECRYFYAEVVNYRLNEKFPSYKYDSSKKKCSVWYSS